ncbi:MAG TPA: hypothetical protein VEH04_08420 [Verrucomicrobiae bacterium]|nr:hypothetical protein [Verrucomicrobiae bacterium]
MKLSKALSIAAMALTIATTGAIAQNEGGNQGNRQRQGGGNGGGGGGFGGGNFDPAEFQQRRLERLRESMGASDDGEWKVIQERAQKVWEAQLSVGAMRIRGGGRGGGGGGGGFGGGRGNFQPSPEAEALRNAIDNNAPTEQLKAALQKYRDARKSREAALEKAQADLKQILSVKQEAVAVSQGLLD